MYDANMNYAMGGGMGANMMHLQMMTNNMTNNLFNRPGSFYFNGNALSLQSRIESLGD